MELSILNKDGKAGKKVKLSDAIFAIETNDLIDNATSKLKRKNLDFIIANSLENKGAGFGHDTNQVTIIDERNNITNFELMSKKDVAAEIINYYTKLQKLNFS